MSAARPARPMHCAHSAQGDGALQQAVRVAPRLPAALPLELRLAALVPGLDWVGCSRGSGPGVAGLRPGFRGRSG
jgi:hypothetical protein